MLSTSNSLIGLGLFIIGFSISGDLFAQSNSATSVCSDPAVYIYDREARNAKI